MQFFRMICGPPFAPTLYFSIALPSPGLFSLFPLFPPPLPSLSSLLLPLLPWSHCSRNKPVSGEQALSCHVPFTTVDLGDGVWRSLSDAAKEDGVTLKLRGCKSSGRHDSPKDYRSLAVYGNDANLVKKHFLALHDAAVNAGIDAEKFNLPDRWAALLLDRGGCVSPLSAATTGRRVVILTLGVRFMTKLIEYRGASRSAQAKIGELVDWHERNRHMDPGSEYVMDAMNAMGFDKVGIDKAFGVFMKDPAADTSHLGRSPQVMKRIWREQGFFQDMIGEVKSLVQAGNGTNTFLFYCRSGRHRSVSAAAILGGCLEALGFDVRMEHLCDFWWRWVHCQKAARWRAKRNGWQLAYCEVCDGEATPEQNEIYAQACRMWHDA
jgi:hypothetical protein